ncbi:lasso RiPP family leader peptide-containing protein [Streptomyces sp. NPDC017260]
MTAVQETLENIGTEDVYEPPLLAEAGQYAQVTQGEFGDWPDFPVGLWL